MSNVLVTWARAHPRVIDGAVAAAVFVVNVPVQAAYVPEHLPRYPVALLVSAGLCLPYVARRNHPVASFAAMALVSLAQVVLGVLPTWANAMLLAGLYTVATGRDRRVSITAAAVVELGAVLAALRWGGRPLEVAFQLSAATVFIVSVWMWGHTIGTRRAYVAGLRERAEHLERDRDNQARIAAAAERARIAREMHDIVSHSLSLIVVQANGAAHCLHSRPDSAHQALTAISDIGQNALTEMRHMLEVLRDGPPERGPYAPRPGLAQLERLVEDVRSAGLPVELTVHGEPRELPDGVDLAAYRIVQEALTNTRKHAGPQVSTARVSLRYGEDALDLRVSDDGRGAGAQAGRSGGHGLVGIRERVAAYGGSVRCGPADGGGFEVVAALPVRS
ncbi:MULTISPECIES: sensor histidine kinase [unclassified Nonomuraea]|uniref:sensor histidine kinase n=1 Tax=unclassified Nonomuraea TaxID=2593643 RepID=UPI0013772AD7|nr:histidine kinase [Nonomuraea sp. KC401]NBE95307.1 sensor histidine kinase [Nonomuraea sp. K271]